MKNQWLGDMCVDLTITRLNWERKRSSFLHFQQNGLVVFSAQPRMEYSRNVGFGPRLTIVHFLG